MATGVGEAAWDVGAGAYAMVRHPVRTAEGVVHAATHPVQTATAVWDHGKATATACASGDGGACGRGAFELGSLALGGAGTVKAAGKLGKLRKLDSATDAARAAGKGENIGRHAARGDGREATGFLGSRRAPLANAPYQQLQNADAVIRGKTFSGHALDQMRNRGLVPSVVENAIETGIRSADPIAGRLRFFDPINKVTVITEGERVITVIPGRLSP